METKRISKRIQLIKERKKFFQHDAIKELQEQRKSEFLASVFLAGLTPFVLLVATFLEDGRFIVFGHIALVAAFAGSARADEEYVLDQIFLKNSIIVPTDFRWQPEDRIFLSAYLKKMYVASLTVFGILILLTKGFWG